MLLSLILVDHGASITHQLSGQGSDPLAFTWFMAWWPWSIAHHVDPFFTRLVWQPVGVSLLWITTVSLLAVLGAPLTLLAGPVVTYNVYVILAPLLSAWFAYLVCFRLTRDGLASLFGGFLFGFSTYEMAQDTAALNLSFTFLVPAMLLLVFARLDDAIRRPSVVMLGSIILIAEFLICIEIFALMLLFGGVAWALALLYMPERRAVLQRLVADGLVAAPIVALVLLPFIVSMVQHYRLVHLPEAWPYFFTADFLNVFIPSGMNLFGASLATISGHFNGGIQEQDSYIGIPLLLIVWRFGRERGGSGAGRLLVACFLIFLVASFGPRLWIGGHYSPLVLPWMIFVNLPLLSGALPARFALFVSLTTSLIAALWIASPGARHWRVALGLVACIALLPRPHPWRDIPNSVFFEPGRLQAVLGPNPRILILPFSINGPSSFWQQENGFGFTQTGGYLGFPPAPMQKYPAVGEMFGNVMGRNFLQDFSTFCLATHTQYIVVGAGANPAMVSALAALDWQTQKIDDVVVYKVPKT